MEKTLGIVGISAGIVLAGVGATLFALPTSSESANATRCGFTGNGLLCAGTF